ncbi:MAG: Membrane-associated zinc metalloprotease [Candidatus Amesbacteria bacterium GW2011_GWA2_42_12]|uniref:Membrane-associated zinc metalloprotease n=1 Tax=Candidatus Amesbacteria bacterium GW2011_GWA2_42_12 TaxID=1618356 RepID=A0A0G1AFX2_9BACT|nr:MAG: Membrane-associated zinc metalloprotease [Candidatus Amesbacteria bacterium GW2011_GWA2_42_12]
MTFVIFLLVLSVLVLIHELGHFVAARMLGIKVEEFAFGLPFTRHLFQIKRGETMYSVYPVLFGGFVKLYGEDASVGGSQSFWNRGRKHRMLVTGAGVVMNIILALVFFVVLYMAIGVPQSTVNKVTVTTVENDSPAKTAGLLVEDKIVAVEGKQVADGAEFGKIMRSWAGIPVNLTIERGRGIFLLEGVTENTNVQKINISITGRINPPQGQGPLGVGIADFPYLQVDKCSTLNAKCSINAMGAGIKTTGIWVGRVFDGLRGIGKSLAAGKNPEGVSGVIGIYQLTDVVSQGGFWPVIELMAILSVNLAVFNILPIPALDGGRMLFIWIEWARRKRITSELEQRINSIGMTVLIILMILITLQDVVRTGVVDKLWKLIY